MAIPGEDDFFEKPNNLPLDKLVEKVGTKIII